MAGDPTLDLNGQAISASVQLDGFDGTIINSSSAPASFAGAIADSDFTVGGSGAITLSGAIEGYSTLTESGSGALTLTGDDAGDTILSSGTLIFSGQAWGDSAGSLEFNPAEGATATLMLNDDANITVGSLSGYTVLGPQGIASIEIMRRKPVDRRSIF